MDEIPQSEPTGSACNHARRSAVYPVTIMEAKQYEYHPFANAFPMMNDQEFAELVGDIEKHGLREELWLYEGKILDGRNRYKACQRLGVKPYYSDFEGTFEQAAAFVVSKNLVRRHQDESSRAMSAARVKALTGVPIGAVAASFNVGRRSVTRALRVLEKGTPEQIAAVDGGKLAVSAAAHQIEGVVPTDITLDAKAGPDPATPIGGGETKAGGDQPAPIGTGADPVPARAVTNGHTDPGAAAQQTAEPSQAALSDADIDVGEADDDDDPQRGNTPNALFLLRADEALTWAVFKGKVDNRSLNSARATASAWYRLVKKMESTIAVQSHAKTASVKAKPKPKPTPKPSSKFKAKGKAR
jgi:hypothetical protein